MSNIKSYIDYSERRRMPQEQRTVMVRIHESLCICQFDHLPLIAQLA